MGFIGIFVGFVICLGIVYYTNNLEWHERTENTELANDVFGRIGCIWFVMLILMIIAFLFG
jgi:uncharacterized membrane protein YjgN (DUF898 family)